MITHEAFACGDGCDKKLREEWGVDEEGDLLNKP